MKRCVSPLLWRVDKARTLEGGCLCGDVQYRIALPVIDAGYCHCRACQRSSGAPVVAWLTVQAGSFSYDKGAPTVFRSSPLGRREFCPRCGTQLAIRHARSSLLVDVTISSLRDPALVPPQYHIWTASQVGWLSVSDLLPRYEDAGPDST